MGFKALGKYCTILTKCSQFWEIFHTEMATLGLAPLHASGPLEANSLSGGKWPERGVFLSTDGGVSYLYPSSDQDPYQMHLNLSHLAPASTLSACTLSFGTLPLFMLTPHICTTWQEYTFFLVSLSFHLDVAQQSTCPTACHEGIWASFPQSQQEAG